MAGICRLLKKPFHPNFSPLGQIKLHFSFKCYKLDVGFLKEAEHYIRFLNLSEV
jgi:hypothetical protein